jgi:S1-C subfamily serine protease
MAHAAGYKVNNQSGEIGERIPMNQDDWSAFALSAPITHGDSGGPVINNEGEVIAINVTATIKQPGIMWPSRLTWLKNY